MPHMSQYDSSRPGSFGIDNSIIAYSTIEVSNRSKTGYS